MSNDAIVELYAVRNKDGQWFHASRYRGYSNMWVSDINQARIYPKETSAKRAVSLLANTYPDHWIPDIVKLVVTRYEIIDQHERVNKQKEKKKRQRLIKKANKKKKEIAAAEKKLEEAQKELQELSM